MGNVICTNKKAKYNYQILESVEAGIKLLGLEVKGLRERNVSIDDAWVKILNGVFLVNASILPSKVPEWEKYNTRRDRTLLLRKTQIRKLQNFLLKGLTIIPLKVYFNARSLAKVEIAVVKGKKLYDKRDSIKKRDIERFGY